MYLKITNKITNKKNFSKEFSKKKIFFLFSFSEYLKDESRDKKNMEFDLCDWQFVAKNVCYILPVFLLSLIYFY